MKRKKKVKKKEERRNESDHVPRGFGRKGPWGCTVSCRQHCLSGPFKRHLNRDSCQPRKDRFNEVWDRPGQTSSAGARLRHEALPLCASPRTTRNRLPSFDTKVDVSPSQLIPRDPCKITSRDCQGPDPVAWQVILPGEGESSRLFPRVPPSIRLLRPRGDFLGQSEPSIKQLLPLVRMFLWLTNAVSSLYPANELFDGSYLS